MKYLLLLLIPILALAQEVTPTERVNASMNFEDDLDFKFLPLAIDRQLEHYKMKGLEGTIQFGSKTYDKLVLKKSLELLKKLSLDAIKCSAELDASFCKSWFSKKINEKFAIYRPIPKKNERGYNEKKSYFTSYYTPDFRGSREKTPEFKNPIFGLPQTEEERLYSRVEVDFDRKLDGKNLEIMWVKETLFDIYFMHIEGGGRVVLPDGSTTYLSYAGKNGKKFEFISQYLMDSGLMERGKTNYFTQRAFLEEHPEHQRAAYATAPFFIYFSETNVEPYGLDEISLTESRSLAWDNTIYKTLGVINFIKTVKTDHVDEEGAPVKIPFSRFFLAQDTGSAIRGNARADLYWGSGEEALVVAGSLMGVGVQYFLIKKEAKPDSLNRKKRSPKRGNPLSLYSLKK
jgi:membrane-bound lytic murein transglycosylase